MALFEYEFSISDDFISLAQPSNLNITLLQKEIDLEVLVSPPVHHILANIDEDSCVVYFETELTTAEEDKLAELITAHTGSNSDIIEDPADTEEGIGGLSDMTLVFGDEGNDYHIKFSSENYRIGFQYIFPGTNFAIPTGSKFIMKGEGSIRIYDLSNNVVLAEWDDRDFGNDWNIWTYAPHINFPANEAIIEFQGRKTGCNLYMSCYQLCYREGLVHNAPPNCS
jgi:hypothetical protein